MSARVTIIAGLGAGLGAGLAAGIAIALGTIGASHIAAQEAPSFHLVYHSDTRGYYRPCG
jgi:hypothetical protein